MNAYEGLTVAAAIQKGILTAPGKTAGALVVFKSQLYNTLFICHLHYFFFGFIIPPGKRKDVIQNRELYFRNLNPLQG